MLGVRWQCWEAGFPDSAPTSAPRTEESHGVNSGYRRGGIRSSGPTWTRVKVTCRIEPNQQPREILRLLKKQLKKLCPPGVRLEIEEGHGAEPYLVSPTGPQARAALGALRVAFGHEPVILREGGSIPIITEFKKVLGADSLLLGLALPDDNLHSPNEKFDLTCFHNGAAMSARLWPALAAASS